MNPLDATVIKYPEMDDKVKQLIFTAALERMIEGDGWETTDRITQSIKNSFPAYDPADIEEQVENAGLAYVEEVRYGTPRQED